MKKKTGDRIRKKMAKPSPVDQPSSPGLKTRLMLEIGKITWKRMVAGGDEKFWANFSKFHDKGEDGLDIQPSPEVRTGKKRNSDSWARLTPRETEILILIRQGKSNPEIAKALSIKTSSVKSHVSSILSKTGSSNRFQLASRVSGQRQSED